MKAFIKHFKTSLFFLALLLLASCQREITEQNTAIIPNPVNAVDDNIMVTAGVRGIVVDESNKPVTGATVKSGTNTTTTDRYGVFRFSNISLSKENGHVIVEKNGFFTGHRTFPSTTGRIHNVRIKLITKNNTATFSATTGGIVNLASGGKLVIPANAIADASGTAYSGQINVAMTWIDPTAVDLGDRVMGDLRGITTTGEERGLETFGMLGVELTSPGGQKLNIAAGKKADLTFPIPAAIAANAPATIDLWHFDEAMGRWLQEGTATKTGNNYAAQVSHFSFWNCDAPFPLINLCMTIKNGVENIPMINAQVKITRANGSAGYGYTDSLGNLCGKVPKNEALTLQIIDPCGTVAYSQSIGPFAANASLGVVNVNIPPTSSLTITGTLQNCTASNVTNGVVLIYLTGGHSYSVPVTNGNFSLNIVRCNNTPISFSALGVDYVTLQQSIVVGGTGTTGTVSIGTLQACGTSAVEYVELLIDGTPYNYVSPPDQLTIYDSLRTGAYTTRSNVTALRQANGTTGFFTFTFSNNEAPANNLPLENVNISLGNTVFSNTIITASPVVNTTTFGPPNTGFVEGSFSVQMNFAGTPKSVICNFRIRR